MGTYHSFWKTVEVDAISRDFDYANYVTMCQEARVPVLCSETYSFLRMAFNAQMSNDIDRK